MLLIGAGCAGLPRPPSPQLAREMVLDQRLPRQVDLIIVHGCPVRPDGAPSTCNQRRARAALRAYQQGLAPKVLFTGAAVLNAWPESEVTARHAIGLGLPPEAVLIENESRHTVTNLSMARGLMRRQGMKTAVLVSEAMHLVWAKQLADALRMRTWLFPADPLPPYTDRYQQQAPADEYEPWRSQTTAYGLPRQPLTREASRAGARQVVYIAVADFRQAPAPWRQTLAALARQPGAQVQELRWSSYDSLAENARKLSLMVDAWTRGFNGAVDEVVVVGFGWGGVIARGAAARVHAEAARPVRVVLVDAPLSGQRRYARDWSRTRAPLRWAMLGTIRSHEPPAAHVALVRLSGAGAGAPRALLASLRGEASLGPTS